MFEAPNRIALADTAGAFALTESKAVHTAHQKEKDSYRCFHNGTGPGHRYLPEIQYDPIRHSMKIKVRASNRQLGAPTILDVARAVGVSKMTVSRVINEPSKVAEATRVAVRQAISRLNYTPNVAARMLAGVRQISIGLLLRDLDAGFLNDILLGCMTAASSIGAHIIVKNVDIDRSPLETIQAFLQAGVDGIILAPPLSQDNDIISLLNKLNVPFVALNASRPDARTLAVLIDDFAAAQAMTAHLLGLGHRRIGFIGGNSSQSSSLRRLMGYRTALRSANVYEDDSIILNGLYTFQSGFIAAKTLLSLNDKPTAIFACNDDMAAAAVAVAHRLGINVPKELSVCGFDDTLLATSIWPQLTTIRQPLKEMAKAAVAMLLAEIRPVINLPAIERHRVFDFELIHRQSDAPPQRSAIVLPLPEQV